jgi:hypothetical protein
LQTNYPEGIRTLIKELKLELLGPEYDFEDIGLTDLYKEIFHYTFSLTIEPRVVQDDELVYQYEENLKRSDFFPIQNTLHKLKNYINKNLLGKTLKYDPMFPFKLQNGFLEKSQLANMIDSYYKNPNYSSSIRPICLIFNAGDEEKIKVEEYYRELVNKIKYDMDILRIHGKANELKKLENINLIKVGLGDLIFQLSANRSSTNIVCSSPFKNKQKLPLPLKQNVIQRAEIFRRKVYKEQYGDKRLSFVPIIPEFKKEFFK